LGMPELVDGLHTELLLFDPIGDLVAITNGNASDGVNSLIDFTIPSFDVGQWIIEVTASPSTPTTTFGDYVLTALGATGGSLLTMAEQAVSPPAGTLVAPPGTILATFTQQIYGLSLTPGELQINGVPAVAVAFTGPNTATWTVAQGSIPAGTNAANVAAIGADVSGHAVTSVAGTQAVPFSYTIYTSDALTPPVAEPDQVLARENTPTNIPAAFLLSNDSSPINGPLSIIAVNSTSGASVTLTNSGTVVIYSPPPGLYGLDQFTYTLSDGRWTATGTVKVIILSPGAPAYEHLVMTGTPADESFKFSGYPGASYMLQSAPALNGPWTDIYPAITAGLDGLISATNSVASPPPIRFFRMRQWP
jgi:hypothetical protein